MFLLPSSGGLGPSSVTTRRNAKRPHLTSIKTKTKLTYFWPLLSFLFLQQRDREERVTAAFWVFLTSRVTLQTHLFLCFRFTWFKTKDISAIGWLGFLDSAQDVEISAAHQDI